MADNRNLMTTRKLAFVLQVVTQDERQLPGRHQVAIVGHGRTLPHAQMPFTMKSRIDWVTFLSSSVYVMEGPFPSSHSTSTSRWNSSYAFARNRQRAVPLCTRSSNLSRTPRMTLGSLEEHSATCTQIPRTFTSHLTRLVIGMARSYLTRHLPSRASGPRPRSVPFGPRTRTRPGRCRRGTGP